VVRVPGNRYSGPGFDSRRYQIFWKAMGLERGPLSLVRIIEELLEWKIEINGRGNPLRWPRDTLYPQELALTSPTSGGGSVGISRLRTKIHGVLVNILLVQNFCCLDCPIILYIFLMAHNRMRAVRFFILNWIHALSFSKFSEEDCISLRCVLLRYEMRELSGVPVTVYINYDAPQWTYE
jgi:hypothetical protein